MKLSISVALVDLLYVLAGGCFLAALNLPGVGRRAPISSVALALFIGSLLVTIPPLEALGLGVHPTLAVQGAVALVVGAVSLGLARHRRGRWPVIRSGHWRPDGAPLAVRNLLASSSGGDWFAAGARLVTLAMLLAALLAAFNAVPFLDDSVTMWLPKGLALTHFGLNDRLFLPNATFRAYAHPDYPLLWSIMVATPLQLVGHVDVRAPLVQSVVLLAAFVGSIRALLRQVLPAPFLDGALMLLVFAPELLRETQSGGADLFLSLCLTLTGVAGALWLRRGDASLAVLACVFGLGALYAKSEGLVELGLVALTLLVAAAIWRRETFLRTVRVLAVIVALFLPFAIWRLAHGVTSLSGISISSALNPAYLAPRVGNVGPAVRYIGQHLVDPAQWLALPPIALALCALAAWRRRSYWLLVPAAWIVAEYAFWIWVNWTSPRLSNSMYRVIMPIPLVAALTLPFALRSLFQRTQATAATAPPA